MGTQQNTSNLIGLFEELSRTSTLQIIPPPKNGEILHTDYVRTNGIYIWLYFSSIILIMCHLILTKQNRCIQLSLTIKILFRGYQIACFPYGQLPNINVNPINFNAVLSFEKAERAMPEFSKRQYIKTFHPML